jgi:hypothetical protein
MKVNANKETAALSLTLARTGYVIVTTINFLSARVLNATSTKERLKRTGSEN